MIELTVYVSCIVVRSPSGRFLGSFRSWADYFAAQLDWSMPVRVRHEDAIYLPR